MKKSYDTTQTRRQQKRRAALNEAAQNLGFESWSKLETAVINNRIEMEIKMKSKGTYYAWAQNEQGASTDVIGRTGSLNEIKKLAHQQFGSGWTIHVMLVVHDGDDGAFPPEEVEKFKIR